MAEKLFGNKAAQSNLDVDYVISYRFTDTDKSAAQANFEKLIHALAKVGLEIEVRNGDNLSLLVFIKSNSDKRFNDHVYRSRVKDWLHGVRATQPDREALDALASQPMTEAERYRIIYQMITSPVEEGGAGIIPKKGEWQNVESLFPLHDIKFNKQWIQKWSTKTFLKAEDLDEIRDRFGEKIAFYFAFTQSYFAFLIFPAAFGFSAWVLLGHFSPVYAIFNTLWCVTFVEYWKKQEVDLAVRWGVKGVSAIQEKRKDFKHEKEIKDPITGETVRTFSAAKRLGRQALQIPFAVLAALSLGTLIATCFGIEIFLSEIYNGPFKSYLVLLPTVILTVMVPNLTAILTGLATKLNDYENWDTTEGYEAALTQKLFTLNFITGYLPIFLTAFVYVPFGRVLVPYLDVFKLTTRSFVINEKQAKVPSKTGFEINPSRLRKQVIYFTLTAQIVNFMLEVVVPYVKRRGFHKYQDIKAQRAAKQGGTAPRAGVNDVAEEVEFLKRVRGEAELDHYDVTTDLREMVVQYGYLSLFSVVWPLTPVSFIINNWVELRSDAAKICIEMQRPTPHRADSIGPWLDSLAFLTWLGSLTSAALVYMFSNDGLGPDGTPAAIKGWALLISMFFSEHIYLIVQMAVRLAISKLDTPGTAKDRAERYMVRKRYLEDIFGSDAMQLPPSHAGEKITRATLEEEARLGSLRSSGPSEHFWARQRGWEDNVLIGKNLIARKAPDESKKVQ